MFVNGLLIPSQLCANISPWDDGTSLLILSTQLVCDNFNCLPLFLQGSRNSKYVYSEDVNTDMDFNEMLKFFPKSCLIIDKMSPLKVVIDLVLTSLSFEKVNGSQST